MEGQAIQQQVGRDKNNTHAEDQDKPPWKLEKAGGLGSIIRSRRRRASHEIKARNLTKSPRSLTSGFLRTPRKREISQTQRKE